MRFSHILALLIAAASVFEASAQSAIYACGHIRRHREVAIDNLRNSGYATAIIFNVNVEIDGSLTTDFTWSTQTAADAGGIICQNGKYVFDEYQPFFKDDVKDIITSPTSVSRLEICIGGWTNGSYGNIKSLIQRDGTGPETILYRNFKALKEALPDVVAVNNDQEQDYDVNSAIEFHKMLYEIGFKTTIAPYTRKSYWQQLVQALNKDTEICEIVYLQTYGGGASNRPADWDVFDGIPMYVGFDCESNSIISAMSNSFGKWAETEGVVGGFIWNYNSEDRNHNQWAASINRIFNTPSSDEVAATFYGTRNFRGYAVGLTSGTYPQGHLALHGIPANDITSIELKEGSSVILFKTDDCSGPSITLTESTSSLPDEWDNAVCSLIVKSTDSGVDTILDADRLTVVRRGGEIEITGVAEGEGIQIFDASGRMVYNHNAGRLSDCIIPVNTLSKGTYLICVGGTTIKFVL